MSSKVLVTILGLLASASTSELVRKIMRSIENRRGNVITLYRYFESFEIEVGTFNHSLVARSGETSA